MATDTVTMDKIVSLARRRGFVFPSSEIYGGLGSAYDYGHYGVLAKNNVKARWLEAMVQERDDIVAIDSAIILNPAVWEASGHVAGFSDPLVDCRTCEFEQMEMEFFVPPDQAERWYRYWLDERYGWYTRYGLRTSHLRIRPHEADELSHYSSGTSDIEYLFPIGWSELEGVANRGDFDLTQHAEFSGEKLEYFDQATGERYVPHVIEPAAGADRATLAFLVDSYDEEVVEREGQGEGERRTVLRLHPRLAPVKAAVLPLVSKEGLPELAEQVHGALRARVLSEYDSGGAIGGRYRRQAESG